MASTSLSGILSIDSQHDDMIHDSQFDYYAKKLATCSSDRTVKIFDITGDIYHNSATLTGHEGPVWQVAWAHPKFGTILASCSYDGSVLIHRENSPNSWTLIHKHRVHESSVNSVSWAPHEYGLLLACASSDGRVSILEYKDDHWAHSFIQNDTLGCNAVSWAPYGALGAVAEDGSTLPRLVTGACDNSVNVWKRDSDSRWSKEEIPFQHSDWVRDVSWAPNTAMPFNIIASCSEDRTVCIWKQTERDSVWLPTVMKVFDAPVWRVSWSITGNVLAVSTGDHKVTLWKQSVDESWSQISTVDETSSPM